MAGKKIGFEENLRKLEACAEKMKAPDMTLEASIKAFEEGMKYYDACKKTLEAAEEKIAVIRAESGEEA